MRFINQACHYAALLRAAARILGCGPASRKTLAWELERAVAIPRLSKKALVVWQNRRFTYSEVDAWASRLARSYRARGVVRDSVVALMMENRPAYIAHLFALWKLGATVALVNPEARGTALRHMIDVCHATHASIGSECLVQLQSVLAELRPDVSNNLYIDLHPDNKPVEIDASFKLIDADAEPEDTRPVPVPLSAAAAYIFTSGTTGLPKAAKITHRRLVVAGHLFGVLAWRMRSSDVIYNCLPLCHSNGLFVGLASVVNMHATLALARRFSTHGFWQDVQRHGATGFNYIGEMCTYLLNTAQPGSPKPGHSVRRVVGQGLRRDLWSAFIDRFAIPSVVEFYASTEGNLGIFNLQETPGAVGKLWLGTELVRWDPVKNIPLRDPRTGYLQRCAPSEPGVLLGPINKRLPFDGYLDRSATETKIVREAFRKGDAYFNTGDLFQLDAQRNLYFLERLGDSYRWKGENIAASEVQNAIARWRGVELVNAYGVAVPAWDGRAGMVALVLRPGTAFEPGAFARHVDCALPRYARPAFVRVCKQLDTTATLKLVKTGLQAAGFDPDAHQDELYFRRAGSDSYEPLSREMYPHIASGSVQI